MKRIFKYPALPDGTGCTVAELPCGAEVIEVDRDPNGEPSIWAIVDPEQTVTYQARVLVLWTGHEVPDGFKHHKTWQAGQLVLHQFIEEV